MLALFTRFKTELIGLGLALALYFGWKKSIESNAEKEVLRRVKAKDVKEAIDVYQNEQKARQSNARDSRNGTERLRELGFIRDE